MHSEQSAPILQLFPHKHSVPHPSTTREFIGDYLIQIPPLGDQIKKGKNMHLLKIQFQRDFIL